MNFLQLTQELARKAGTSGTPSSVVGQVGESNRLITYVSSAWVDIQNENADWSFAWRESETMTTAVGTQNYLLATDCRMVVTDSLQMVASGVTRKPQYLQFKDFRQSYRGATASGIPAYYTITPADEISFYPIPDAAYTYSYDYFARPQILAVNTDIPSFPERYHMAIVWLALKRYGQYEQDGDVIAIANDEYQKLLTQMSNELLPDVGFAGAFV